MLPIDPQAQRMVDEQMRGRGIRDERVLDAMSRVPRRRFVPSLPESEAYLDRALPTAEGQTISQPYMVARMTELLRVREGDKVLEVGTGSGYQTAVLILLGAKVVSVERSAGLADWARRVLTDLELVERVEFVVGDGTLGWPAGAPFDRIIVTAGAPHVPQAYFDQAAENCRIVIPVGDRVEQRLMAYERTAGEWEATVDLACRFVPLVGADGWGAQT